MAAAASGHELDPLFLKAISLLHSKHPDSANQLKNLVQNYREKVLGNSSIKKGDGRQSPHVDVGKISSGVRIQPVTAVSSGNASDVKRALSPSAGMIDAKLTGEDKKLVKTNPLEESIEEITVGSSLQPKRKKKTPGYDNLLGLSSPDSDPNDSIPIDQIIEMDFGGPTCTTCNLKPVEEDNALMECSECHSSYHQKCHKPNVTTKELNDPRLIWYCSQCVKKMKKEMAAQQASNNKTTVAEAAPVPKALSNPFQQSKPFRRISTLQTSSPETKNASNSTSQPTSSNELQTAAIVSTEEGSSSREGSPSPLSKQHNRSRDMTRHAMNRLEQVKKRAKLQQAFKQTRK